MTLLAYLRQQASADSGLSALLGIAPFRWYDRSLPPQNNAFPAVVARLVSNPTDYTFNQRMTTSNTRVQFTIWGGKFSGGITACENVDAALTTFLDSFNAVGIPGLLRYQNEILNEIDGEFPYTDGPIFTKLMDVRIFSNAAVI